MSRFQSLEFEDPRPAAGALQPAPAQAGATDGESYVRQAEETFRLAQYEKALRYYSRALEFDPNLTAGWVGQVRMLIEMGELSEAELWARKAMDIFGDNAELLAARAIICARKGNGMKAMEFSDASTNSKGASPYVWLVRGEILLATHRRNEDHCFEKAIQASGGDWLMILLVARAYQYYHKASKGMVFARKALERNPTSAFVWNVLGHCQRDLGLTRAAKESYREALSLDRDSTEARDAATAINNRTLRADFFAFVRGLFHWRRR